MRAYLRGLVGAGPNCSKRKDIALEPVFAPEPVFALVPVFR